MGYLSLAICGVKRDLKHYIEGNPEIWSPWWLLNDPLIKSS